MPKCRLSVLGCAAAGVLADGRRIGFGPQGQKKNRIVMRPLFGGEPCGTDARYSADKREFVGGEGYAHNAKLSCLGSL